MVKSKVTVGALLFAVLAAAGWLLFSAKIVPERSSGVQHVVPVDDRTGEPAQAKRGTAQHDPEARDVILPPSRASADGGKGGLDGVGLAVLPRPLQPKLFCPGKARDVALLFWSAPLKVSVDRLCGSSCLNAAKIDLGPTERDVLAGIISRYQADMLDSGKKGANSRHAQALDLQAQGKLVELNETLLTPSQLLEVRGDAEKTYRAVCERSGRSPSDDPSDPERLAFVAGEIEKRMRTLVPDGVTIVKQGGRTYVATRQQIASDPMNQQYDRYLRDGLFGEAIAFLAAHGMTPPDTVASVLEAYEALSMSGR